LLWRAILVGIVLVALLFLAFCVGTAIGLYEHGNSAESISLIAGLVLHRPFFWVCALILFLGNVQVYRRVPWLF